MLKVGMRIDGRPLGTAGEAAKTAEDLGYDFITSNETAHNPFLPLVLAAEHTDRVDLVTSIALAFARSPMGIAYVAWDLQQQSAGRLVLGLGSQVRGHIVRRFSMTWSPPARRMREYILALRTIWDCFQNGTKLEFIGDSYNMNLMPPLFNPGPIQHPDIRVQIAAVNPGMLAVAGEVCDGVLLHTLNSEKYTEEVILPNLARGASKSGRTLEDLEVSGGGFIVTGASEEELEAGRQATKNRIAFYASTRSYAPVMNVHGWNDTSEKLYRMSVNGEWANMGRQITDEMLETFAVVGLHDHIVDLLKARYGSYASSVVFSIPTHTSEDRERLRTMVEQLRAD